MHITVEDVGPKKAEAWLNSNKHNRKMRDGIAERYASDMKHGRWTACPEPISFYEDGDLADGQHRLWAIIESGATVQFPVARGLSRADGLNINTGLGRTLIDNARISGTDSDLSKTLIVAAKAVHYGGDTEKRYEAPSNAATLAIVNQHREAAEFAARHVKRRSRLCGAVVLGAVARAWYHEADKARLIRFCDVLGSGLHADDGEMAASVLRNYLMTKPGVSTTALWRDTFLKAQNAVSYFMRGKRLTTIKAVADEAYPLPTTKAAARRTTTKAKP